ncbi:hypothetical protein BJY01DRAFT_248496 [Aspergillus pseudoustus]|uniref:Uncharacterized protein n=1 Tax=Aspergillus pseudoustus TaxID=1810923 RepID=A0ABR4JUK5_9EURO
MSTATNREFDCYCFLCCGPLGSSYLQVGSSDPDDLTNRRGRVETQRLALERGDELDSDDSSHESDYGSNDDESQEEEGGREEGDESESEDEDQDNHDEGNYQDPEHHSYDLDLATSDRTSWLRRVRVPPLTHTPLASQSSTLTLPRAFISGPATYEDMGRIWASPEPGEPHQASTGDNCFDCYTSFNDDEIGFPFHDHCMTVLQKALQWYYEYTPTKQERRLSSSPHLDLDALYEAASRLTGWSRAQLDLNYGEISGAGECWDFISEEEFSYLLPHL